MAASSAPFRRTTTTVGGTLFRRIQNEWRGYSHRRPSTTTTTMMMHQQVSFKGMVSTAVAPPPMGTSVTTAGTAAAPALSFTTLVSPHGGYHVRRRRRQWERDTVLLWNQCHHHNHQSSHHRHQYFRSFSTHITSNNNNNNNEDVVVDKEGAAAAKVFLEDDNMDGTSSSAAMLEDRQRPHIMITDQDIDADAAKDDIDSSIIGLSSHDDDDDDDNDDDDFAVVEEQSSDSQMQTQTGYGNNHKEKKDKKGKKSSNKSRQQRQRQKERKNRIAVLQLQSTPTPPDVIKNDFLRLSYQFGPSKFKWIDRMATELVKLQQQQSQPFKKRQRKTPTVTITSATKSDDNNNEDNPQRRLWRTVLNQMDKRKVPKEMRAVFCQRMVETRDSNTTKDDDDNNSAVLPKKILVGLNKKKVERDLALLQQARALAIHHPLSWSRDTKRKIRKTLGTKEVINRLRSHSSSSSNEDKLLRLTTEEYLQQIRIPALVALFASKDDTQQRQEAEEFQMKMWERLPSPQYQNSIKYIQDYVDSCQMAEQQSNIEAETGDGSSSQLGDLDATNDAGPDDAETNQEVPPSVTPQQQQHSQQELRYLKNNLQRFIPKTRFHLAAKDFAEFFHITAPDTVLDLLGKHAGGAGMIAMINDDGVIRTSQEKWEETQKSYVQAFQDIQNVLQSAEKSEGVQLETSAAEISLEESILETFDEVAANASSDSPSQLISTQRVRPRRYTIFEAMNIDRPSSFVEDGLVSLSSISTVDVRNETHLNASHSSFLSDSFPEEAPTERLVFIDNLPIDIEVDRLTKAFGRCGDIEALQIFHRRQELDPGKKSNDKRKKIRSPSNSSRRQRWQRPRTPLYGMVLFKEASSATKAVADPLRIFGMVLDHHLIRSQKASSMTRLYLEDVSLTHDTADIEYDLSRILHPDLYVCLDASGHRRRHPWRGMLGDETSSCMIKFPTFETAYWAYQKLSLELDYLREENGTCELHWMQTPPDAMLYWTRQLNF